MSSLDPCCNRHQNINVLVQTGNRESSEICSLCFSRGDNLLRHRTPRVILINSISIIIDLAFFRLTMLTRLDSRSLFSSWFGKQWHCFYFPALDPVLGLNPQEGKMQSESLQDTACLPAAAAGRSLVKIGSAVLVMSGPREKSQLGAMV